MKICDMREAIDKMLPVTVIIDGEVVWDDDCEIRPQETHEETLQRLRKSREAYAAVFDRKDEVASVECSIIWDHHSVVRITTEEWRFSAQIRRPQLEEFVDFVAGEVMLNGDWKGEDGSNLSFQEAACRRLHRLGVVVKSKDKWVYPEFGFARPRSKRFLIWKKQTIISAARQQ